jgi:hypothetical protein
VGMGSAADLQQRHQWQQQEEVQGVMVEAVRQLREQVTGGWCTTVTLRLVTDNASGVRSPPPSHTVMYGHGQQWVSPLPLESGTHTHCMLPHPSCGMRYSEAGWGFNQCHMCL